MVQRVEDLALWLPWHRFDPWSMLWAQPKKKKTSGPGKQRGGNSKNQREMLAIKSTVTEMEETLMGFINRPSTAEERISELEDISETSKAEKQTETKPEKRQNIQGLWDNTEGVIGT